ncbi:unnamed protein product, partial [Dicrocoelium dendriticum]
MSLATVMMISLLFVSAFCEKFTTGVQLHVRKGTNKEVIAKCSLLTRLAPELWQTGGFQNCIILLRIGTITLSNIVQYRVTVDIEKMPKFPEMRAYFEKVAFVNQELNSGMSSCTTTTGNNWQLWELNRGERHIFRMYINVNLSHVRAPICDRLLKIRPNAFREGGFHECYNAQMDPDEMFAELHLVCLKVRNRLSGEFFSWMSDEEVALRVETMFNSDAVGCVTHDLGYIAGLVQKTFYVSGPSSRTMCRKIKENIGVPFHAHYVSCSLKQIGSSNFSRIIMSLYRLKFKHPFYAIDQFAYMEYQSKLIKDMNRPFTICLYNGYSQLEKINCRNFLFRTYYQRMVDGAKVQISKLGWQTCLGMLNMDVTHLNRHFRRVFDIF